MEFCSCLTFCIWIVLSHLVVPLDSWLLLRQCQTWRNNALNAGRSHSAATRRVSKDTILSTKLRSIPIAAPHRKRHRFTEKQRHYVASLQNYSCFLCGAQFCHDLKDMDIDHILALERGGTDWPDLTNLSALCVACHRRKTILERQRAK